MGSVIVIGPGSIFRAGIVSLLDSMGFDHALEAENTAAIQPVDEQPPSKPRLVLLLLDNAAGADDVAAEVRELRALMPTARIVFLADRFDLDLLIGCFTAGANAYLLVTISSEALCESLRLVCTGENVFPSELASLFPDLSAKSSAQVSFSASECDGLSSREAEILQCLTNGQSNKMIARNLDIAEATVKVHVKRILRKVHVSNRTQAALWALSKGIARLPAQRGLSK